MLSKGTEMFPTVEILGLVLSYAQRGRWSVAFGLFRQGAFFMVCTSEALSVGSFRMSVRKSAVNEKKDVVYSVTVLLWFDPSERLLYLPKDLWVLSSFNYLQLCDEDILKGVDFCTLDICRSVFPNDCCILSPDMQLCDVYWYSGGNIMQNRLYPCFEDQCVLAHRQTSKSALVTK